MDVVFCAFNGDISRNYESNYQIKSNYKEVFYISLDSAGVKESENYKLVSNIQLDKNEKENNQSVSKLYNDFSTDFSEELMLDNKLPMEYNSHSFLGFNIPNLSINQEWLSTITYSPKEIEEKIDLSEIEKLSNFICKFIIKDAYLDAMIE